MTVADLWAGVALFLNQVAFILFGATVLFLAYTALCLCCCKHPHTCPRHGPQPDAGCERCVAEYATGHNPRIKTV